VRTCPQCSVNYPDAVEFCPRDGSKLPGMARAEVPAALAVDPMIGSTIDGRYLVEAHLGQGGMGYVYAGRHAIIDKRVAIKVLRAEHAQNDESAGQRFLVEARAASKIGHQNIVDITDFGVLADGRTYFVMEFLDGPTLGKVVHEKGYLKPQRAIPIVIQIARGLAAAHDKGIVHRDLKPENVFVLNRDGTPDTIKIVDFGIAKDQAHKKKLTQAGMVLGTPEYMSPEQATGQATDHRVDQYALGCMLYEMLTGDVPYRGATPTKTLTMHVFDKVVPPSQKRPDLQIPPEVEKIVLKAIQKKPGDRYADLREMMVALELVDAELNGEPGRRDPSGAFRRSRPAALPKSVDTETTEALARTQRGRRTGMLIALGAGAALLVFGVALAVSSRGRSTPPVVTVASPAPDAPAANGAAPPPPSPPTDIELVLRTQPQGAEVFEGAERLGATPLTMRRPRSATTVTFTFRRSGYRDELRQILPNGDKDIEVVLQRQTGHSSKVASSKGKTPPGSALGRDQPPHTPPPKQRISDLRNPFD
jgi:tRNA A-37 threonylcarbamoyl transferase component Bud32